MDIPHYPCRFRRATRLQQVITLTFLEDPPWEQANLDFFEFVGGASHEGAHLLYWMSISTRTLKDQLGILLNHYNIIQSYVLYKERIMYVIILIKVD